MRASLSMGLLAAVLFHSDAGAVLRPEPKGEAPVSLTSSDGTGLKIVRFEARGVVEDPLAFTELHLTFHNPESRQIEGQFEITLPPHAAVSRFAMRQSWGWQEGEVVELSAARAAYEDFLHRRQDPALLEKAAGNQFRARVFPIPAGADKEIILSYSQELPKSEEPYRIFLRGLPTVDALDIKVFLGKRTLQRAQSSLGGTTVSHEVLELQKRNFTPDTDFAIPLPQSDGGLRLGLRHQNLAVARITPVTDAAPDRVENLLVLFDSSASRAPGWQAQLGRLKALIESIGQASGAQTPIKVACFDQEVADVYTGPVSGFGASQLAHIADRRALGASDLGRALGWVANFKDRRYSRVLVITDGIATAGATEGHTLRPIISALGNAGIDRLDVVVAGGIRDEVMLKRLVTGGLKRDGVVLDEGLPPGTIAMRLSSATFSGIKITAPGATWVWPAQLDGVQPGDQVLVYADLPNDQPLEVVLEGARAGRHPVKLQEVPRPLLERAWVSARIQRLSHQRETLAANDADLRAALKTQIVEISTKFRVLCDYTALLVLETEADYARFHIDRRALTDILVVGTGGLELMHRSGRSGNLVGQINDPQPETTASQAPAVKAPPPPSRNRPDKAEKKEAQREMTGRRGKQREALDDNLGAAAPDEERSFEGRPRPSRAPSPKPVAPEKMAESRQRPMEPARPDTQAAPPSPVITAPPVAKPTPEARVTPRPPHGGGQMDNDRDGIPDATDRCPNEPETFNGFQDEDGCPDRGRVIVSSSSIIILDKIYFPQGRAAIQPQSRPILDAMAATLSGNPQIVMVELQGHADDQEDPLLTNARAQSVKGYLVGRGVAPGRLMVRGYGRTRPLCSEANESCWAKNRRVELAILARSDGQTVQPRPDPPKPPEVAPYEGRFLEVMVALKSKKIGDATRLALAWRDQEPGDVLALIALGEVWEAAGKKRMAARAYGSVIDLYPGRADLRRFAGERLERLGQDGAELAIDTFAQAKAQRPDHPASHRLLAFALLRAGKTAEAFEAALAGTKQAYPSGRFLGVDRILREDLGLIAAAWLRRDPKRKAELTERLSALGAALPEGRSLRFVLNWETDANDVDFHIYDAQGGHAYYQSRALPTGGELYADVTTGYGPECFTIPGDARAFPYRLQAHYYSRGPMGYGMGKLQIVEHDGKGGLSFEDRPFVIMTNGAFVELGQVTGPLATRQ